MLSFEIDLGTMIGALQESVTASRKKMKVPSVKEMHSALNSISKYSGNEDGAPKVGRPRGSRNVPFKDEQISSTSPRWTTGSDELRPSSIAVDGYDYVYSYPLRETNTRSQSESSSSLFVTNVQSQWLFSMLFFIAFKVIYLCIRSRNCCVKEKNKYGIKN